MMALSVEDLPQTVFAKTPVGQDEIQNRTLKLPLMIRRLLLLVDGKRPVQELAAFVAGQDVQPLIQELLEKGCIETVATEAPPARSVKAERDPAEVAAEAAAAAASAATAAVLAALPPPQSRSAKQIDMARNFMINTINTMLEQNTRLTLVEKIFAAKDAAELRDCFAEWETSMEASWIARKRLPELRKKLFAVL
jgi:hypothetical protein